jgi:hypothetical protein
MRTLVLSAFSRRFRLQPLAAATWCALVTLVVVDRCLWVSVSQWREDAGTNLWLGYSSWLHHALPPVGLLSSKYVPNPNGMPLVSMLLSLLPSLFWVSLTCSLAQAAAIVWASYELSRGARWVRLSLALPPLACVFLRAASVELWNQWLFITINALLIALVSRELRRHHPLHYLLIAWLSLLSPTLYLMGLLNGLLFSVALCWLVVHQRKQIKWRDPVTLSCLGLIVLGTVASVWLTWLPYLNTLPFSKLTDLQSAPLKERMKTAWLAIKHTRKWIFDVHPSDLAAIWQSHGRINGPEVQQYAELTSRLFVTQLWIAALALLIALIHALVQRRIPLRLTPLWLLLGVMAAYAGSPLLGGFPWHEGERADQSLTFLIWLFWAAFSVPLLGRALGKARGVITLASVTLAFAYTGVAAWCGASAAWAHLVYRGSIVSVADVPLVHKEEALAFIATDWRAHSDSDRVPLHYDMVGEWSWIPVHGELMLKYLPDPVFTVGRALDWELLRRFQLHNAHEGEQKRAFSGDRYVMTYAGKRVPRYVPAHAEHHLFGRIRVSVVPARLSLH